MKLQGTRVSSLNDLQKLIHEKFDIDPAELGAGASMRAKGVDSLALVELLFAIEDRFGISMSDEDSNIDTLGELAALVDKVRAKQLA